MKTHKNEHTTNQNNNKLKIIPIISLYDLAQALTRKETLSTIDKNVSEIEKEQNLKRNLENQLILNSFYFQLVNNNESLDIYYIYQEMCIETGSIKRTVLSEFFDRISITRNDKNNYLNLILYNDNNKILNNFQIGPFFKDKDGYIYKTLDKNITSPIKETINHLLNLRKRIL